VLTGFYQAVIAILLAIGVVVLVTSGSRRSALAA
jgi:hypothetical protein